MRRRTTLLAVGVWLLVVTGCAALVWTVISQAGEGVTGTQPVVATPGPVDPPAGAPEETPASPGATPPTATTPTAPSSAPGPVRRTWQGPAGVVVAECRGAAVSGTAQPASGWRVEVDDNGPQRLRVEIESVGEGSRVRVEAVCEAGTPAFSVDAHD